jgi:hypothetical protein
MCTPSPPLHTDPISWRRSCVLSPFPSLEVMVFPTKVNYAFPSIHGCLPRWVEQFVPCWQHPWQSTKCRHSDFSWIESLKRWLIQNLNKVSKLSYYKVFHLQTRLPFLFLRWLESDYTRDRSGGMSSNPSEHKILECWCTLFSCWYVHLIGNVSRPLNWHSFSRV